MSREKYFDIVATVRITTFGDPDKETHKCLKTLQNIVDLHFPNATVDSELILP